MAEPIIAGKGPAVVELEAGTYFWCQCGASNTQPYCDGAHAGTAFQPVKFKLEERKRVALCQCKRTKNQPFCDGTHSTL